MSVIGDSGAVALYLDMRSIDASFEASKTPRILQDLSKGRSSLKDILFTTVDRSSPLIANQPECECGVTKSKHGTDEICPVCLSTVAPPTERSVTPSLFVETPTGIDAFLYPYVYYSLSNAFDIGKNKSPYNAFATLLGGRSSTNPAHKIILNRMPAHLIGYNNAIADLPEFIDNLCDIILDLLYPKDRGVVPKEVTNALKDKSALSEELFQARELALALRSYDIPYKSQVIPVRSKLLMTLEEGTYSKTSKTTDLYASAIVYLNNMPHHSRPMTDSDKANYRPDTRIVRFYEKYTEFRNTWYREEGAKGGAMRTDTVTSRSALVLRSVQSQIVEQHHAEEVHLPYSQSIVVFQAHIVAWYKRKYKWSSTKILEHIAKYTREYNEELWQAMDDIVQALNAQGGIAYSIRYPSIYRTSGQAQLITRIKKDPADRTLGVSSQSLAGNNGDSRVKV